MRRLALVLTVAALPVAALAEAPDRSYRPEARPGAEAEPARPLREASRFVGDVLGRLAPSKTGRPEGRPEGGEIAVVARRAPQSLGDLTFGPEIALCGVDDIRGRKMRPVPGRISGCGIAEPVRVASIAGVALSRPVAMDCRTARALRQWTAAGLKPAIGKLGGGATSLRVAAGYACRTRNNQPGGKISEHGRGRAIDISAIGLRNGQTIEVLTGWDHSQTGPALKNAWRAACGPFSTVLGPEADRFHKDHLHFDTTPGRGPYCR